MNTNLQFYFISLIFLMSGVTYGQWEPEVRLTYDPFNSTTSFNNAWCVTSSGSFIHVVWADSRDDENYEIYYKRSADAGLNWGPDNRLTNNTSVSENPSIATADSIVHVVWHDSRTGYLQIFYKRSADHGITWEPDLQLTNVWGPQMPSLAVSSPTVHVVWHDYRDGNWEIYHKRSPDDGIHWETDTRLTNSTGDSDYPSVAASGLAVHIVWYDSRDGNYEIYYKRSVDAGLTWGPDTRLTNDPGESDHPSIAVSGLMVHVVWRDKRDGYWNIYYKRSTDGGITWETDKKLTNNVSHSYYPSVAVSGPVVHLVWQDDREGSWKIFHTFSSDNGINWQADTRLSNNTASHSVQPSVAVSGSAVHVVWKDNRDLNPEIYYRGNPTGSLTGINQGNWDIPNDFRLDQNHPNPFISATEINYQLPFNSYVTLIVFDFLGREVKTLVDKTQPAGIYSVTFSGDNLPAGIYYYRLATNRFNQTKKMVLHK